MAHITTSAPAGHGFWATISDAFTALGRAFMTIPETNEKIRKFEALNALSDAELAARGMRREDIAFRVFAGSLY